MLKNLLILAALTLSSLSISARESIWCNPCWYMQELMHKIHTAKTIEEMDAFRELIESKYGSECAKRQRLDRINEMHARGETAGAIVVTAVCIAALVATGLTIKAIYKKFFGKPTVEQSAERNPQEVDATHQQI